MDIDKSNISAVILAAGKGTRMKSDIPKVLHKVAGRPMIEWVVKACLETGCKPIIVVGYKRSLIEKALEQYDVIYAYQEDQLGTGHAVQCAEDQIKDFSFIYVLAGDGPLIRPKTLTKMLKIHLEKKASATLATSYLDNPTGYGRIIRDISGRFTNIIEEKNATQKEKLIKEIYPSYALFNQKDLILSLQNLCKDSISNEYYITNIPKILVDNNKIVEIVDEVEPEDVLSINTLENLYEVDKIMSGRINNAGASV